MEAATKPKHLKTLRRSHAPVKSLAFTRAVRAFRVAALTGCVAAAGLLHAATFNVTDYGAVGDDSTDNTAAFTVCLSAVIAAGGGKMYLPDGVYLLGSNLHGLDFATANHASRFGRICVQRNTHHLTVSGRHGFSIQQMNTEQPGAGQTDEHNKWQTLASDINDPDNLGAGDINYWVVLGGVGAVDTFTKTGGTGIHARRIGSAP